MGIVTESLVFAKEDVIMFVRVLLLLQRSRYCISFGKSAGSLRYSGSVSLFSCWPYLGIILVRIRYSAWFQLFSVFTSLRPVRKHVFMKQGQQLSEEPSCSLLHCPACPLSEFVMHPKISDNLNQTRSLSDTGMKYCGGNSSKSSPWVHKVIKAWRSVHPFSFLELIKKQLFLNCFQGSQPFSSPSLPQLDTP